MHSNPNVLCNAIRFSPTMISSHNPIKVLFLYARKSFDSYLPLPSFLSKPNDAIQESIKLVRKRSIDSINSSLTQAKHISLYRRLFR
jgi:hypothetical protein